MLNELQEIEWLKKVKNAIILAYNYQTGDVQEIADFVGDSLKLCMKSLEIEESDIVVFCGVDFMAETAIILDPCKKILIPDREAECPMAWYRDIGSSWVRPRCKNFWWSAQHRGHDPLRSPINKKTIPNKYGVGHGHPSKTRKSG